MDLYQELVLEHYRRPHRAGLREPFDAEAHHVNPTCGDEVTLRVALRHEAGADGTAGAGVGVGAGVGPGLGAILDDVSYQAVGCAISVASSSVLAEEVTGHSVREALGTAAAMRAMLTSRGTDPGDEDVIGDGVALAGVARYPARVKCALLGWAAFTDALARAGVDVTEAGLTTAAAAPAAAPAPAPAVGPAVASTTTNSTKKG